MYLPSLFVWFGVLITVEGINTNLYYQPPRACSHIGRKVCELYSSCMLNPQSFRCVDNTDPNYDRFKVLVLAPLSAQIDSVRVQQNDSESADTILAAQLIALNHVNENILNGTEFSTIEGFACNFRFHYEVIDTQEFIQNTVVHISSAVLQDGTFGDYDFIISGASDDINSQVAVVANAFNIPMISSTSFIPALDDYYLYPTFKRTSPSSLSPAVAAAEYLSFMGYNKAVFLYSDESGSSLRDTFSALATEKDVELSPFAVTTTGEEASDTIAFQQALVSIIQSKLNIIVVDVPIEFLELLCETASEKGLVREGVLWIYLSQYDENILRSMLETSSSFASFMEGQLRIVSMIETNDMFDSLNDQWTSFSRFEDVLNKALPGGTHAPSYVDDGNFTKRLADGIFNSSTAVTSEMAYAYDSAIVATRALCTAEIQNVDLRQSNQDRAKEVRDVLNDEVFSGTSGQIKFADTKNSRQASNFRFVLVNLQDHNNALEYVEVAVFSFESETWNFTTNVDIIYYGETIQAPLLTDPKETQEFNISVESKVFIYLLVFITYGMIGFFYRWTYLHRFEAVVIASQPKFLKIVLVGSVLMNTSIIFWSDDLYYLSGQSFILTCQAAWSLWSFGATIATSALNVKMYRIFKTFINPKMKVVNIRNHHLLLMIQLLCFVDAMLLLAWFLTNPLVLTLTELPPFDEFGRPDATFFTCSALKPDGSEWIFLSLILLFHLSLFIVGGVLSFKSRNVSTDFQEGHWIGLALASQLQLLLFAIPTLAAVAAGNSSAEFVVTALVVAIMNGVLLCAIFIPKVFRLRYGAKEVTLFSDSNKATKISSNLLRNLSHFSSRPPTSKSLESNSSDDEAESFQFSFQSAR